MLRRRLMCRIGEEIMRNHVWGVLVMSVGFMSAPCHATPLSDAWHTIAAEDSRAALALIENNHPGAVPELGDATFQARLALAKAHVAQRLPRVVDYPAYAALMSGLAADFQDGHIWSNALVGAQIIRSSGILLARQNNQWVVGAQQTDHGEPDVKGHIFLGCDGQDAESWAVPRIARFKGDPVLEAVRARAASWLLLDEGNPFLVRPTRCTFSAPGHAPESVALHWQPVLMANVRAAIGQVAQRGDAGLKVEPFSGGWWIGLDTLEDEAQKVVTQVRHNQAALREAPMVVIDLRGNGGGNSRYADIIAELLVGEPRLKAAQPHLPACSGSYWRVSPGVLAALQQNLDQAEASRDAASINFYRPLVTDIKQALAQHRNFSPALPACARHTQAAEQNDLPQALPPAEMKGRLVLVTDHTCFSSCLIAVDLFRRLGALHVGETTDRSSRYMEVREEVMPSKLRAVSTLQKVAVGAGDFGPYTPEIIFPGVLSNDAALKTWVAGLPAP